MPKLCLRCGQPSAQGLFTPTDAAGNYICPDCKAGRSPAAVQHLRDVADKVVVTTTHNIDGHYVASYISIETVEFVFGTGLLSEFVSDVADLFGQRSTLFEGKLAAAKKSAMDSLKFLAARPSGGERGHRRGHRLHGVLGEPGGPDHQRHARECAAHPEEAANRRPGWHPAVTSGRRRETDRLRWRTVPVHRTAVRAGTGEAQAG